MGKGSKISIKVNEAKILSRYLIGVECVPTIEQRYFDAILRLEASFTDSEERLWLKMLQYPWFLKLVDSGLAIVEPQSPLRKRIFIMLCILEASREYTLYFLPQSRSIWYIIPLGFKLALSALLLITGVITVKLMRQLHYEI